MSAAKRDDGKVALLEACQMAYRKHSLADDSVGWEALGEVLATALAEEMGDEAFVEWVDYVSTKSKPITE